MPTRHATIVRGAAALILALTMVLLSGYSWPQFNGTTRHSAGLAGNSSAGLYNWLQFNGNAEHSGDNALEGRITPANVGTLHKLFQVALPDVADGAPVVLTGVSTSAGTKDLVFLTTKDGHVLALDAHTGTAVWSHQYGPGTCLINGSGPSCYTTSSPAIDPNGQYVYSYGFDGQDGKVHKYAVGTGAEVATGGWPELTTLKDFDEKESPALSLATLPGGTSYLYVANGGYFGDSGDYQGHITAINLATGTQKVFNTLCSNQTVHFVEQPGSPDCPEVQSAVWARPGVIYDPDTSKIFIATGNGTFDPAHYHWGDSVLALNPDGTGVGNGNPLDSYTPTDYQYLDNADLDFGSTAPAILPTPSTCGYRHIAAQSGKDGIVRIINLDNLSGAGAPGHTGGELFWMPLPQGGEVLTQPAVWVQQAGGGISGLSAPATTWLYVANDNGITAFKLSCPSATPSGRPSRQAMPTLRTMWTVSGKGTSPIIANGVLFYATPYHLIALNAVTGAKLYDDNQYINDIHWESPVVANGIVYLTDEARQLTAYSL